MSDLETSTPYNKQVQNCSGELCWAWKVELLFHTIQLFWNTLPLLISERCEPNDIYDFYSFVFEVVAPVKFWFCFALFELSVAWFALKLNMLSASINVLQMFLRSLPPRYNLNSTDLLALLFCDAQMNYPSLLPTQNWCSVSLNSWILEACF